MFIMSRQHSRLTVSLLVMTHLLVSSFMNWHKVLPTPACIADPFNEISSFPQYSISGRPIMMSTRQTNNANNIQIRKKIVQPLLTSLDKSRIRIGGQRWILPGDYIVHEEYGVGRYLGVRMVDLTPARGAPTFEPTVEVQYADGEVSWFQRIVEKELWLYRSADAGDQELSSMIDRRKWKRRKISVEESSKSMAVNLSKMKAIRDAFHRTPCVPDSDRYLAFEKTFTFDPTEDQITCFQTIASDMINNTRPMDRLVCGDVGFGKTEVAIRAIYRAVLSKKQVAFLAPTRVLALQHLRVLRTRMPDVNIQLLRGGGKGDALKVKEMIKNGECEVVVGTHALLQPTVTFTNLGLLVIDEEQRFGVGHKEKLKAVSGGTDVLTLSATPIPRTLQMSMANLRDLSLMNTAPVGRKEVNVSVSEENMHVIRDAITAELRRGGQVFVVVPFVRDVTPTTLWLKDIVPDLRVMEAHGRHEDLEDRIDYFSSGQADVLVATTVIENGVDMPNVNTIIVLSADRFGMSALYQLRGRVGRSPRQAFAYFMTNSSSLSVEAELKLHYLSTLTALGSGYELSRRDMEMRGFGTIFGADQSGTCDVGLDLQANILETAAKRLNQECILSISDSRVSIGCALEVFGGQEVGPLPPTHDLSGVSRWEAALAEKVIFKFSPKSGTKKRCETYDEAEVVRNYLASGTPTAAEGLRVKWTEQLNKLPVMLEELLKRSECRMACRRLGIVEVRRSGAHMLLLSSAIDNVKWEGLSRSIPDELKSRVLFDLTASKTVAAPVRVTDIRRKGNVEAESQSMGVICIRDVFADEGGKKLVSMPPVVLALVLPLAAHVDQLLNDAILACDPDKAEKDAAKDAAKAAKKKQKTVDEKPV